MARGLVTGAIAAGAAAIAATSGVVMNGQRGAAAPVDAASLAAPASAQVCIDSNVRLVEGMARACMTSAEFEALRDRPVIDGQGEAAIVNLAGPDPASPQSAVRTCAQYDAMVKDGWYALSNAEMRREEYFKRACNALSMLAAAKPAAMSHFSDGHASAADIRSMADGDAIGFGETAPSVDVSVEAGEPGVWKVTIGEGETFVHEIAHADFNGDGVGEILAYVSVGAHGGTARSGVVGLIEKAADEGPCTFTAR